MDGPSHYREAERLLACVTTRTQYGTVIETGSADVLAAALAHATLSLAAATALNDQVPGLPQDEIQAWQRVAAVQKEARQP